MCVSVRAHCVNHNWLLLFPAFLLIYKHAVFGGGQRRMQGEVLPPPKPIFFWTERRSLLFSASWLFVSSSQTSLLCWLPGNPRLERPRRAWRMIYRGGRERGEPGRQERTFNRSRHETLEREGSWARAALTRVSRGGGVEAPSQ